MYEWHEVRTKKDMPRRSGDILFISDMGWKYIGYWDAHKRELSVYAIRNHYDLKSHETVLEGKVDCYPLSWKNEAGMCVAWCEIPATPKEWEEETPDVIEIS